MCCMLYWDLAGVFSFTRNESPDRSPAVVEEGVIEGRPSLKRSTVEPASKARCALEHGRCTPHPIPSPRRKALKHAMMSRTIEAIFKRHPMSPTRTHIRSLLHFTTTRRRQLRKNNPSHRLVTISPGCCELTGGDPRSSVAPSERPATSNGIATCFAP